MLRQPVKKKKKPNLYYFKLRITDLLYHTEWIRGGHFIDHFPGGAHGQSQFPMTASSSRDLFYLESTLPFNPLDG